MNVIGVPSTVFTISSTSSCVKPPVAILNDSYPCSKIAYSTKPLPLGSSRNSDSKDENTTEMNGSGSRSSSSSEASKGYLIIVFNVLVWLLAQEQGLNVAAVWKGVQIAL